MWDMFDSHPLFSLIEKYRHDRELAPIIALMDEAHEVSFKDVPEIREEDFDYDYDYTDSECDFVEAENARRYRIIMRRVERLVEKNPLDPGLHALLGYCREQVPVWYKSRIDEYERAIGLAAQEISFKVALRDSLWEEAELLVSCRLDESDFQNRKIVPWIRWDRSRLEYKEWDFLKFKSMAQRCLQLCDEILKIDPNNCRAYEFKAGILEHLAINRIDEALETRTKVLELAGSGDSYHIHQSIGELLLRLGRYKEALEHFQVLPGKDSIRGLDEAHKEETQAYEKERRESLVKECELRLRIPDTASNT